MKRIEVASKLVEIAKTLAGDGNSKKIAKKLTYRDLMDKYDPDGELRGESLNTAWKLLKEQATKFGDKPSDISKQEVQKLLDHYRNNRRGSDISREDVALKLVRVAKELIAGCEKLPDGPMRENCEKKEEGKEKESAQKGVISARGPIELKKTGGGLAEKEDRYVIYFNGKRWGELYYNMRGYVAEKGIPVPKSNGSGAASLQVGEQSLSKMKKEIAKANRKWSKVKSADDKTDEELKS